MDAFALGRVPSSIVEPYCGEDKLFASCRLDKLKLENATYSHCTFANVSFLEAEIDASKFRNCVFVECYFRKSRVKSSSFVGSKFINCNFNHCSIQTSDFRYSEFRGSAPPFAEIKHSAPPEPNLRAELFMSLAAAAQAANQVREARAYKLAALNAENHHLKAAIYADSTWYRNHYPFSRRAGALALLIWHYLNYYLWRHGESASRLLISALVVVLVVFPVLLLIARSGLDIRGFPPSLSEIYWLSASNFLLLDRLSEASLVSFPTRALSALESLAGLIFAGMYVTLLIKALLRR